MYPIFNARNPRRKPRLVIIGNGMAGMRTVEELLAIAPDKYAITVFGAEPYGNYNRIMLSSVLCGDKQIEDIVINDRAWYQNHKISLHAGPEKEVVNIERGVNRVHCRDGSSARYDRLLIATGSNPVILPIPGIELQGVVSFRQILDVNTMLKYTRTHKKAVVLGGGLLGLEAANGLAVRGMDVTVVHSNPILMNRQMDGEAASMLKEALSERGLDFKMPARTVAMLGNDQGHVTAARFADGSEISCDLFVTAIGVRPNIKLAKNAGLYCERGIVVDDTLQTYDPCIYAVGECVQHRGETFGLVAPLFEQAKVCANHLSGHCSAEYRTLPTATRLKVSGIQLFSLGNFLGDDACETIQFSDPGMCIYKKLVLKDRRLVGVVLYGDTADGLWYQQLLESGRDLSAIRECLIFGQYYSNSIEANRGSNPHF